MTDHTMREAFEVWGKRNHGWVQEALNVCWDVDMYRNTEFQKRWETWQAAWNHRAAPVVTENTANLTADLEKAKGALRFVVEGLPDAGSLQLYTHDPMVMLLKQTLAELEGGDGN